MSHQAHVRYLGALMCLLLGLPGCNRKPAHEEPSSPPGGSCSLKPPGSASPGSPGAPAPAPAPTIDDLALDQQQREFLWDVEHQGNVLSAEGWKPLADALSRADEKALTRLFADDFVGRLPTDPRPVTIETEYVTVVRQADGGAGEVGRAAFAQQLLSYRRGFGEPPSVKLALMALTPVARDKPEGPWQGTAQLRMWGQAPKGQPREVTLSLAYRIDPPAERYRQGAWLHQAEITQSLVSHARRFLFRDAAVQRGLDPASLYDSWTAPVKVGLFGSVFVTDYDRDGILDMLVTDPTANRLYKGLPGGRFRDVTTAVGLNPASSPDAMFALFADFDGDGYDDLLLGRRVLRNDRGRGFLDWSARTNLLSLIGSLPTSYVVGDYDRDGRADVYLTRAGMHRAGSWLGGKVDVKGEGCTLLHNLGDWQFADATDSTRTDTTYRSVFSAAWLDADDDGWPDLYVINEFGGGQLLVNQRDGTFRPTELVAGPSDYGSMAIAAGDVDNDGNIDLYLSNMYSKAGKRVIGNLRPDTYPPDVMEEMRHFVMGSQLYLNQGRLKFKPTGQERQVAAVGWAWGATISDLDNDGYQDLYATAGFISQDRNKPDG